MNWQLGRCHGASLGPRASLELLHVASSYHGGQHGLDTKSHWEKGGTLPQATGVT